MSFTINHFSMNTQENSAHSYTEGSDQFKLSHDPIARAKEHVKRNLMQLFFTECYDEFHNDSQARFIFDWFYSKLSQKEQEIDRLKKELEELKNNLPNQ